jgi:hypothetical protein
MTLRPESSVGVALDVYGELVFAADGPSPVVHRTPEELGLARVVVDATPAAKLPFVPNPDWKAEAKREEQARAKLPAVRVVKARSARPGVGRRGSAIEVLKGEETVMDEVKVEDRAKCAYEGCQNPAARGKSYCGTRHAWKNSYVPVAERAGGKLKKKAAKVKQPGVQLVQVDPQRKGSASSLLSALAKIDAGEGSVRLSMEMTQAEIAGVLARLSDGQRQAFIGAGMKAVLLEGF